MSADSPTQLRIVQLDGDILQLEETTARIRKSRAPLEIDAAAAASRLSYLNFARWFRAPTESYGLWRLGVLLVLPAGVGALAFILMDIFAISISSALWGCALAATCAAALLATVLRYPSDAALSLAITQAEANLRLADARLANQRESDGLSDVERQLRQLLDERHKQKTQLREEQRALKKKRREEIASGKQQRLALLQRNWKAMRSDEWEEYLVEVCRALGGKAERTGKSGDQGCDLAVQFGQRRIAVQAKGYYNVVGNKAVQEAVASVDHYGCDASAVITNSRFTRNARKLAESNCCTLIGEDEFPDFVMGNIDMCGHSE